MIELVIALIVGAAVGLLVYWLIFASEGVYLGRRVVIWLYDLYAGRYDAIVQHDDVDEHLTLAQPIMRALHPRTDPAVLDIATGTGRIPLALCQHARFEGHIVGLDLSQRMLEQAEHKIAENHFDDYVTLVWHTAEALPYPDNSFDLVTCLEALEFMSDMQTVLAELCRVLRPGGVLLTTRRIGTRWFPGRLWSQETMRSLLEQYGMTQVEFVRWQVDYEQVWARKVGQSDFIGAASIGQTPR